MVIYQLNIIIKLNMYNILYIDYYNKYLKYKNKYISLKNQLGGGRGEEKFYARWAKNPQAHWVKDVINSWGEVKVSKEDVYSCPKCGGLAGSKSFVISHNFKCPLRLATPLPPKYTTLEEQTIEAAKPFTAELKKNQYNDDILTCPECLQQFDINLKSINHKYDCANEIKILTYPHGFNIEEYIKQISEKEAERKKAIHIHMQNAQMRTSPEH
jgi:hypothetical protein